MKKKHELEDKIEEVETVIAESSAEKYAEIIMEHFRDLSGEDGELLVTKMWSLKKKLFHQNAEVPMAMKDKAGNLISGKNSLKSLYQTTYEERLAHKPIEEGWEDIQTLKENLFEERIKFSSENKSEDWDGNKVLKICKKLKSGKARDRDDLIYELFKPDLAGENMILSLKCMFNGIKEISYFQNFWKKWP